MKKLLYTLLPLALTLALTACSPAPPAPGPEPVPEAPTQEVVPPTQDTTPTPESFDFSRENLPRLDGSTSTAPLAQAICAALLGEDTEAVADLIQFSRTTQSYRNLMAGEADFLLAAEPAPEVLAELEAGGDWTLTPFATDALVFVVNADNPVDSLTMEQVQKIYTGEITNWKQVGGADMDIVPFQRNAEAGSQTMFEKLVMADLPLMEPPTYWVSDSMSGLLEAVRSYDNSPAAIGYTVYYYANDMKMAKGLKVLSIDGVAPSARAIREGDYPFLNPYFVAIRSDAPEGSSTRALYDWVLGPEGQTLAAAEGYVPVLDVSVDPSNRIPDIDGGRWFPHTVSDLIPGENYGPLYSYVGATAPGSVTHQWIDGNGQPQSFTETFTTTLYGLMTREGKLVTDPCYHNVFLPVFHSGGEATPYPVLLLARSEPAWELEGGVGGQRYAVCARDGSWVTGHEFWGYAMKDNCLLLLGVNGLTHLDCESGTRKDWSWTQLGISEEDLPQRIDYIVQGMGLTWTDRGLCIGLVDHANWRSSDTLIFDPETETTFTLTSQEWYDLEEAHHRQLWSSGEEWTHSMDLEHVYLESGGTAYTLPLPEDLLAVNNVDVRGDYAILSDYSGNESGSWLFRLSTGELLAQSGFISFLYDTANYDAPAYIRVEDYRNRDCALYTPDFSPFLSYEDSSVYFFYQDGLLTIREDEKFFAAYDGTTRNCVFYRNFEF